MELNTPESYPVENITIPINGILSFGDQACAFIPNQILLGAMPGYT